MRGQWNAPTTVYIEEKAPQNHLLCPINLIGCFSGCGVWVLPERQRHDTNQSDQINGNCIA